MQRALADRGETGADGRAGRGSAEHGDPRHHEAAGHRGSRQSHQSLHHQQRQQGHPDTGLLASLSAGLHALLLICVGVVLC